MAMLPFLLNRHLLFTYRPNMPIWLSVGQVLLNYILVCLATYCIAVSGDDIKIFVLGIILFLVMAVSALLFNRTQYKGFFARLIEWFAMYLIVGAVGFSIETHYFNSIQQGWEFYVVTLCIFVAMAYPAYVYRHLWLGKQKKPKQSKQAKSTFSEDEQGYE